ncbi:host-nuclease inhibitor Gam family protein [Klebsiella aerogenes]|uniref:host-nuclease inhibitor Gam family protein n=1 Tax=Klebsiella aerogenes TaxID=548 RepID=UPI002FF6E0E3
MTGHSNFDAVEERRIQDDIRKTILREKEAELSEWFSQSIKPRFIQEAVIESLGGKADELAVNNAFDVCHVEERIAEFIDYLSDEIARQQVIINGKFTD